MEPMILLAKRKFSSVSSEPACRRLHASAAIYLLGIPATRIVAADVESQHLLNFQHLARSPGSAQINPPAKRSVGMPLSLLNLRNTQ